VSRRYGPFDPFERSPFERPIQEIRIPRPPRRFWVGVAFFALAILVFFLAGPLVGFLTETQWYQALGLADVYLTRVKIELLLFLGSLVVAFLFGAGNVLLAVRVRSGPSLRAVGIRRPYLRSAPGALGLAAAALIALVLSAGAGGQWESFALFQNSRPGGVTEPVFGLDVSFYLLVLPFLHAVLNWTLGLVFLTALLVGLIYTWRGDTFDLRLTPRALGHLSALLAVLALVLAASTYVGRYDLLYGHDSVIWGAGYADLHGRIQVAVVRAVVGVLLAAALVANVRIRRLWIPIAAASVWIGLSILGGIYPALVQRIVVAPAELSQEQPYIKREIDFTRRAFGLDQVSTQGFGGDSSLTAQQTSDDRATVDNLRLWDFRPLQDTYSQLQTIRTYYTFHDIDLDRYTLDGKYQQLNISARELDSNRLPAPAQTWVNQKLQYTHGYGVAASPVSAVVGEGLPDYVAHDIPPAGPLKIDKPDIYFGELTDEYVLAPSAVKEFDYPQGGDNVYTSYAGTHGVRMDGTARALWALRTGDFNLLISSQIQDRTQMLFRRDIMDRVQAIAPFLSYDQDPYIVVANGRLYWVLDGYTSASTYPYSQQEADGENYIRNSVKVVVDAYEGTADFYVLDTKDPIIRAYQGTFPTLFKPIDSMPAGIRAHLRVPEQLFTIQASVYRTYHITDPQVFYNREDVWDFAFEQTSPASNPTQLQPYYLLMRLPGQPSAEYLLFLPFTPRGKQNMIAWLAVRNDPPHYGQMIAYALSKDKVIFGPQQISNRINQTPAVSRDFTLLNQSGSSVLQGNLLVVPIGDTFLYFEPIFLKATTGTGLPELKKVILADKDSVAYADSLQAGLQQLLGQAPPPTGGTTSGSSPPPSGGTSAQVAQLAQQALQHYNAAQAALKNGDLAGYASEMAQVSQLLQQIGQASSASPSPAPSPSPSR
jgi:uncharacterized protein